VAAITRQRGLNLVEEVGSKGMNQALELGRDAIRRMGGHHVVIVPGDIPLLTGPETDRVVLELQVQRQAQGDDITGIVPSKDRGGTNFLCIDTSRLFSLKYGPGSYMLHTAQALEHGSRSVSLTSFPIALDIDEKTDLDEFISFCFSNPVFQETETWHFLQDNGYVNSAAGKGSYMQIKHLVPDSAAYEFPEIGELLALEKELELAGLCNTASEIRDRGHDGIVTYSRKVFIPLTRLCRDFCHYCTFATSPKHLAAPYLSADAAVSIARQGQAMGCKEALFTLGEKPELRHDAARRALDEMGFETTLQYVAHVAGRVLKETGLLPHINAGCMTPAEIAMLKPVSASMGIMLENVSERLCEKGEVHYGSPDKRPEVRLQTIADAGAAKVPFTTGILIGIGETRQERLDSLLAIRNLHREHGHIQEVIIQNFVPKADTKMAKVAPPENDDLLWTIAMARIIFGPGMSIQAPPNLSPGKLEALVGAGINDWGGVSPLTPDHVNPESPWPQLEVLRRETASAGAGRHYGGG
jgi:FO synthase